jgi:hypothetical protein
VKRKLGVCLPPLALALALAITAEPLGAADSVGDTVSIVFVGDVMLAGQPGAMVRRGGDPFAPFAPLLAAADVRVANLESVVGTTGQPEPGKTFTFRAAPAVLPVLGRHFDALSVANNHSGDYGPAAFGAMLDLLDRAGMGHFGGGRDLAQAHAPLIVERRGLRIALLGYSDFFPRSFEADVDRPGVAWADSEQIRLDIDRARTVHRADLVIPFLHWGIEHDAFASPRQRDLARTMVEAGADAVIGSHPHVVQDIAEIRGKPVFYSLGNFVFDGFSDEDNNTGWALRLEVDRQGVRRWQTTLARIGKEGVPVPRPDLPGLCWERGGPAAQTCKPALQATSR